MKSAPVIITTLNRYKHFKRCIESLSKCIDAEKTDIYIALDYPPSNTYIKGWSEISEYLNTSDMLLAFGSVNVIRRTVNYGARENAMALRRFVLDKHDTFIITEDDNEFSTDFLTFMNDGLNTYCEREDIFSICGYMYPIKLDNLNDDILIYQGFSGWGWAGWKKKFEKINWDIEDISNSLDNKLLSKKIKSKLVLEHLKTIVRTGNITNDTVICLHQYKYEMYSVFPRISRVRNHGHDGSGIHCGSNKNLADLYHNQTINKCDLNTEMNVNIKNFESINSQIDNHLKPKFNFLNYFKLKLFNLKSLIRKLLF